jgi:hypothetical protein
LNQFLLWIGALSFVGAESAFFTTFLTGFLLTNLVLLPIVLLTILGIVTTACGLVSKGPIGFWKTDELMAFGSVLATYWLFGWGFSNYAYMKTWNVCDYSKVVLGDPNALWACPQLEASYYIMWTLTLSLIIPSLLFLGGLYRAIQQRHRSRETKEVPRSEGQLERVPDHV